MRTFKQDWKGAFFWIIPILFLVVFYFFPLSAVVQRSIAQPASPAEFDPANLQAGWRAIRFAAQAGWQHPGAR